MSKTGKFYEYVALSCAKGASLAPGHWSDPHDSRVCACGAVLHATGTSLDDINFMDGPQVIRAVARRLKITVRQAASLNNGFEGISFRKIPAHVHGAYDLKPTADDQTWHAVGKSLRRHYNNRPKQEENV